MDPGSTLLKATAVTAKTMVYTFDVDVPKHEAWALVSNCSSGDIEWTGAVSPCHSGPGE